MHDGSHIIVGEREFDTSTHTVGPILADQFSNLVVKFGIVVGLICDGILGVLSFPLTMSLLDVLLVIVPSIILGARSTFA